MDPSVKKILNNGFIIAAWARVLAAVAHQASIQEAARWLAQVSEAYSTMLRGFDVIVDVPDDWGGCEQGQKLMQWVADSRDGGTAAEEVAGIVAELNSWAGAIWIASQDIVDGKLLPA